jgi:hypothetical protein
MSPSKRQPVVRPDEIGPGRIDVKEVKSQSGMETKAFRQHLCSHGRSQNDHNHEGYEPFPVGRKTVPSSLELRTDKSVPFVHRSNP